MKMSWHLSVQAPLLLPIVWIGSSEGKLLNCRAVEEEKEDNDSYLQELMHNSLLHIQNELSVCEELLSVLKLKLN